MAGNSTESGRSVASKITAILLAFTEGSDHSLTELAKLAGLPISTAHRLASELAAWRLLERTEVGGYRAGLVLRTLGSGEHAVPSIAERAPCVLEDLTAATGCRSRLGVLRELEVAYIEKQPGRTPVTAFVPAATLPAPSTALGRALLAFSTPAVVEMTILNSLHPTRRPSLSPTGFRRALAVTRLTKIAVARLERTGWCTVAMPVFGPSGEALAAIELNVRDRQSDVQTVLAALAVATRSLSRELADDAGFEAADADAG